MKTFFALLVGALLAAPLLWQTGGCDQSERRVERHEKIRHEETAPIVVPDNGQSHYQSETVTGGHVSSSTNGERRIERTEKIITEETTTIVVPDAPSD